MILISNFRRFVNVACFLLGNSPASEFCMPTFRNTLSVLSSYPGRCRMTGFRKVGVFVREKVWFENSLSQWLGLFSSQTFSRLNAPTFLKLVILHLSAYEDGTDSVPKRRHIKFRRRGITQKKAYKKCTLISQIITLLHVSTLSCHPQGTCNQYLTKLHKYFKLSCW